MLKTDEDTQTPTIAELRKDTYTGVGVLTAVLFFIIALFHNLGGTEKHFGSFGPSDDLYILNVPINTHFRFWFALLSVGITYATRSYIKNTVKAFFKFSLLNTYQKEIRGFSKTEFIILTGFITFVDELIQLLSLSIILSQLDFIIFGNTIHSIFAMLAVHKALKNKVITR